MSYITKSYQEMMTEMDDMIDKALGETERYVLYSAYETDEFDRPINNLEKTPVKGKIKFISEDYEWESEVYDSPTWLDIAVIANKMIIGTQDYNNKYLEDIDIFDSKNGITTAYLFMGS